jgi:hypothetical protein
LGKAVGNCACAETAMSNGRERKLGFTSRSVEWFLVNPTPVADRDQIQLVSLRVELVNDPTVTDAQAKSFNAMQSLMGKAPKIQPQFVNPPLDALLNVSGQGVETLIKFVRAHLSCVAAHGIHGL